MNKILFSLLFLTCGCTHRPASQEELICVQIVDRNDLTKTISNRERMKVFKKTDFLSSQPYKQVVRVYNNKDQTQKLSKITSYHSNGNLWQYLEVIDSRACGKYQEYYPNGQIAMQAQVIGGPASLALEDKKKWLFDGESLAFSEEGKVLGRFFYEKGALEKTGFHYYPSGQIQKSIPYVHNEINGDILEYFENGKTKTKTSYQQSKKQGKTLVYFENSKLHFQETYEQDLLMDGSYFNEAHELITFIHKGSGFKSFHKQGKLEEQIEYKEGLPCGLVKNFNAEGKLTHLYHQNKEKKEGEEIEYYSGKKPKISLLWHEDQIQGTVKTWYENEKLSSSSEWNNNNKNGLSTSWYLDGALMLVEEYENNRLKKGQYYKRGETKPTSSINEGSGEATLFDPEGNFLKKIIYVQGRPNSHE